MKFFAFLLVLAVVQAVFSAVVSRAQQPDDDDFYNPPSGWQDKDLGTILKKRTIDVGFAEHIRTKADGYQILYRTSGTEPDEPSYTVATILLPEKYSKDKFFLYAPYQDSASSHCAPSYEVQLGSKALSNLGLTYQHLFWSVILNEGYAIVIPDHEGPDSAFGAGRLEGAQTLDSARAALNFDKADFNKDAKIVMYGYSGGAIAAGWAVSLHSNYANELNFVGAHLGGTPASIRGTVLNLDGQIFSGFSIAGIAGVMGAYKESYKKLKHYFKPELLKALKETRQKCMVEGVLYFPFRKFISKEYITIGKEILQKPELKEPLDKHNMGDRSDETPTFPVSVSHATFDTVAPFKDIQETVKKWGSNGADVQFNEYMNLEINHISLELLDFVNVLKFTRDRFEGKDYPSGMHHHRKMSPAFEPGTFNQGVQSALGTIWDTIEANIGFDKDMSKIKSRVENS